MLPTFAPLPALFSVLSWLSTPCAKMAGQTGASATVSVQVADRKNLIPLYAGAAPGLTGVQQVNAAIPADLAAGATQLMICATAGSQRTCSLAYPLTIQ